LYNTKRKTNTSPPDTANPVSCAHAQGGAVAFRNTFYWAILYIKLFLERKSSNKKHVF
jgi:hypothetical protein